LDCKRHVNREGSGYKESCRDLQDGNLDLYEPRSEPKEGGCAALLNPIKASPTSSDSDPNYASRINLSNEARSLNQMGYFSGVTDFIGQIIKVLMAFIGSISLGLYVWAGLLWMTAAGASERIGQAKKILVWTTFGDIVMLGSYIIVSFLFDLLK
jgi:hypothetical protein